MSDFVDKPIQKKLNKNNPITRIEKVERATGARPSASVRALDEITNDLGILNEGAFVDPSNDSGASDPSDQEFSGVFLTGDGFTPYDAAGEFNLGVVQAGVTTYGVGIAGEYANGEGFTGLHKATATSGNTRRLRRGFQEFNGSNEASYLFEYIDTNVGANLITSNPGFETGDATGWTLAGSADVVAIGAISGTYSLEIENSAASTATSNKYACTAGNSLLVSTLAFGVTSGGVFKIRFYNATPTLLSTVIIKTWAFGAIALDTYSANTIVPAGATQFDIYITGAAGVSSFLYIDDVAVSVVSLSNKLGFHGENGAVITEAEDSEIANVAFGTGQVSTWPFLLTGVASAAGALDASVNYLYQITFADNTGGETLPNTVTASIATTGVNKSITLSGIPKRPPGCTTINIYRTEGGGAILYYLATLATDAVTYVDSAADSALNLLRTVPTYNSTIERPFYPPYVFISGSLMLSNATIQAALDVAQITSVLYSTTAANANDLDWFTFPLFIAKGIYTLTVAGVTTAASGKMDWYMDGVITAITAQDWYSAATTYNVLKTGSITIPTSGYHQLLGRINTKNAASTDFRFIVTYLTLTPTAY